MAKAGLAAKDIAGIGITNQRETTIVWDRATGKPLHNAIVWQDRRTAALCDVAQGAAARARRSRRAPGLLLDPYFSATKIGWILDHVEGAREAAKAGRLAFGTIDTFLLWRLTGRRACTRPTPPMPPAHCCSISTAANGIPSIPNCFACRCRICCRRCAIAPANSARPPLFGGSIRILGIAGDQQAATIGQGCFSPGMMKSTYGTGCFALLNTGDKPVASQNRLLTTIAYQLNGKRTYALEGAIFIAGAAVQWLRDALKVIADAPSVNTLAASADPAEEVYLVPAFVGLGAPYWDAKARGAIFGLTRNSGVAELARATIESVGYQTRDLLEAMRADWPEAPGAGTVLRVDGGMTASEPAMQFLADILGAPVDRPKVMETTALGAAYLAGIAGRRLPGPRGLRQDLETRAPFRAGDGCHDAPAQMGRLARCRRAHVNETLTV